MRVSIVAAGPAAEQGTLLVKGDGLPGEAAGRDGGQGPGGVGQDDLAGAGDAEELPQDGQPPLARLGHGGQERLDVVHAGQRPVLLVPRAGQEPGQVADGGQGGLDGVVGAGPGPGAAGPLPGGEHVLAEHVYGRAQRGRDSAEAALAPPGGEPLGLVGGQRQALLGEVVFQGPGQGAHRAARPAGAFEQVLGVIRVLAAEQPAQFGDHRAGAGRRVPGGQVHDEAIEPAGRVGEPGGQVSGLDERPLGTALPARRAQPQPFMPPDLPALRARPGRILALTGPGAGAAPAGVLPQIPRPAAPRAEPPRRGLPGLAPAVPAQGVLLAADRMPALGTGPRAQHAPPGIGLKDPLLPAPEAQRVRGR